MEAFVRELAHVADRVRRCYPHPPEWVETLYLTPANRSLYKAAFDAARTAVWNIRWDELPDGLSSKDATLCTEKFNTALVWCIFDSVKRGYEADAVDSRCVLNIRASEPRAVQGSARAKLEPERDSKPVRRRAEARPEGAEPGGAKPGGARPLTIHLKSSMVEEVAECMKSVPPCVFEILRMAVMADVYLAFAIKFLDAEKPRGYDFCQTYLDRKARFARCVTPDLCLPLIKMVDERDAVILRDEILSLKQNQGERRGKKARKAKAQKL